MSVASRAPTPATGSRASAAYRQLKGDIIGCRLVPGTMLAAQALADRLEMSRTPVHEALKALAGEGLVRVVPRVGYIVTPVVASDIDDIFELRLTLEVQGAGLAAQRVADGDVARLREQHGRGRAHERSRDLEGAALAEALMADNREFHLSIAGLSGNRRLPGLVGELLDEGQRIYFLYFVPGAPPRAADFHGDIVRALDARDPVAARAAMQTHIRDQWAGTRRGAGFP